MRIKHIKLHDLEPSLHWKMIIWFGPNLLGGVVAGDYDPLRSYKHCSSLAFYWCWIVVTPLKDVSAENTVFLGEIIDDDDWLS